ncbi:MAG: hypothetical protein WAN43_02920 [Rhodomicrobium sp.]
MLNTIAQGSQAAYNTILKAALRFQMEVNMEKDIYHLLMALCLFLQAIDHAKEAQWLWKWWQSVF